MLDELLVLDDRSTDDTAAVAADAGATVVDIADIHRRHGVGHGKGNALWASLVASRGDLIVWCDGDVTSFTPDWVVRLIAPLLIDDRLALVKAMYHRPTASGGGGRTTELVARPLLSLFAPELDRAGPTAVGRVRRPPRRARADPVRRGLGRRDRDAARPRRRFGPASIAQVDLGERHHRHRSLHSLSVQAAEVMATAAGAAVPPSSSRSRAETLTRADGSLVPLHLTERPPIRSSAADERPVAPPCRERVEPHRAVARHRGPAAQRPWPPRRC